MADQLQQDELMYCHILRQMNQGVSQWGYKYLDQKTEGFDSPEAAFLAALTNFSRENKIKIDVFPAENSDGTKSNTDSRRNVNL